MEGILGRKNMKDDWSVIILGSVILMFAVCLYLMSDAIQPKTVKEDAAAVENVAPPKPKPPRKTVRVGDTGGLQCVVALTSGTRTFWRVIERIDSVTSAGEALGKSYAIVVGNKIQVRVNNDNPDLSTVTLAGRRVWPEGGR